MRSRSCWKIGRTGSSGSGRARPLLARLCWANGERTRSSSSSSFSRIVVIAASSACRAAGCLRAVAAAFRCDRDVAAPLVLTARARAARSCRARSASRRGRARLSRAARLSRRPALAAVAVAAGVVVARAVPGQREVDLAAHDADRLDLDLDAVAQRERAARAPPDQPAGRLVEDVVVVGQRVDADQPLDERIVDDDEHAEPGRRPRSTPSNTSPMRSRRKNAR